MNHNAQYDDLVPDALQRIAKYRAEDRWARERNEFIAGLDKYLHRVQLDPNRPNVQSLVAYIRSWLVSITLREDPEWEEQISDFERRSALDDLGEPVDAAGLRALLKL